MAIPQTFGEAFTRIKALVSIFQEHESVYLGSRYDEVDARKNFIDKFWMAMGWDANPRRLSATRLFINRSAPRSTAKSTTWFMNSMT